MNTPERHHPCPEAELLIQELSTLLQDIKTASLEDKRSSAYGDSPYDQRNEKYRVVVELSNGQKERGHTTTFEVCRVMEVFIQMLNEKKDEFCTGHDLQIFVTQVINTSYLDPNITIQRRMALGQLGNMLKARKWS